MKTEMVEAFGYLGYYHMSKIIIAHQKIIITG